MTLNAEIKMETFCNTWLLAWTTRPYCDFAHSIPWPPRRMDVTHTRVALSDS
jgi:hypothetical protein